MPGLFDGTFARSAMPAILLALLALLAPAAFSGCGGASAPITQPQPPDDENEDPDPDPTPNPPNFGAAPVVSGGVLAHDGQAIVSLAAATFRSGGAVPMNVDATSGTRLTWLGVHITEPTDFRDSLAVPGTLTDVEARDLRLHLELTLSAQFSGTIRVNGFARDAGGRYAEAVLSNNPVSVYADVAASGTVVSLGAPVGDVAFDPARNVAYLAQPSLNRIAVLSLANMTLADPISTPAAPGGFDLSASGDSLVVALPSDDALGIRALTTPSATWSVRPLVFDTSLGRFPATLRITSNNRALVILSFAGSGWGGQAIMYDLTTGGQTRRLDLGHGGSITDAVPLARSSDRSRMLLLHDNSCCPESAQLYNAVADAFSSMKPTVQMFGPPIAADATGEHFLIKASLFDKQLQQVSSYYPPGHGTISSLSQDGSIAYFGNGSVFFRTSLAEGISHRRFVLPFTAKRLFSVPGPTERILVLSSEQALLVTPGVGISARVVRHGSAVPAVRVERPLISARSRL